MPKRRPTCRGCAIVLNWDVVLDQIKTDGKVDRLPVILSRVEGVARLQLKTKLWGRYVMNRRKFVGMLGSGIAAAGVPSAVVEAAELPGREHDDRPNILFMIADDMTFRTIHSLNNPEVHTPNLDRLVARGCAFTHCFQQGSWMPAVCAPSRTMLNSGLTAFRAMNAARRLSSYQPNDIEDMQSKLLPTALGDAPNEEIELSLDDFPMWAQTFRGEGYDTYITGKWHMDNVCMQRSFMEMGPVGPGMYRSTGIRGTAYQRPHADGSDPWNPADTSLRGHWADMELLEDEHTPRVKHSSEVYADHAIGYIEKKAKSKKPFFMYIGWNAPHDPRQAPQEYLDMYPVEKIEVPQSFLPEHPFNEGDHYVRDEQLAPFPRTPHAVQVHRREYYAILTHMDAQIGRIFDALEKSGKAQNTYVIMTADHGLAVGEHGLLGKQNTYECSMHIPLIMAGPGIPAGKKVDELVYQHSMFATTCELTGVPKPKHVEFPSLAPMLKAEPAPVHDAIFGYYKHFQRCVRTKTHKLILYPEIGKVQLFDIAKDPWEMHDLSEESSMAEVKRDLMAKLKQLQADLDDKLDWKTTKLAPLMS